MGLFMLESARGQPCLACVGVCLGESCQSWRLCKHSPRGGVLIQMARLPSCVTVA